MSKPVLTTQVYMERDGEFLMLHRTKKQNDPNEGKYIAPGGHVEAGETPEECARREVTEETGFTLSECTLRGIAHFISPWDEEEMFIYTSGDFSGEQIVCDEGDLEWVPKDRVQDLNIWEGDRWLLEFLGAGHYGVSARFFRITLCYDENGDLGKVHANPLLLQAEGALDQIGWHLDAGIHKALVVTGKSSAVKSGALEDLQRELCGKLDVEIRVFDRTEENPSVQTVLAAAKEGLDFGADAVIGIGGGSPMDTAKAAALLMKHPDKDASFLYETGNDSEHVPVICIPTTCGTGSEATAVSILSRPEIGAKGSIPYRITPILGLMDPGYLKSAPFSLIRNTALDALAHLCESFLNTKATEFSKAVTMQGLSEWSKALPALCERRPLTDVDLSQLLLASTLGGMAIYDTGTSLPHALSYTVTMQAGLPHGAAVACFLPGYLCEAGEAGTNLLRAAGFSGEEELVSLCKKACPEGTLSEALLDQAVQAVLHNPGKLALCPFAVDEAKLRGMAL